MIKENEFVEYNNYNNNYYGTSKNELISKKSNKAILLLETDIVGSKKLNEFNLGFEFFGIFPPSTDVLKERLIKRGTENEDSLKKRIEIGISEIKEMESSDFIKYKFVNDDLEVCYKELRDTLVKLFPFLVNDKI